MAMTNLVVGDIGGTTTRLALVRLGDAEHEILVERNFSSRDYPSLASVLEVFFDGTNQRAASACFAVAGPVRDQTAFVTNLGWALDAASLRDRFGLREAALVNDFQAVAAAIPALRDTDVIALQTGNPDPGAPMAVLGAGTGLGEAVIVPFGDSWSVLPSEGGHCDFAPADSVQDELLVALRRIYGHVSWERLLSGSGLVNIYQFLRDEPVGDEADGSGEPDDEHAAEIARLAASGAQDASRAFDIFVDVFGAEAGNLALKVLARRGIYVGGGIAMKNPDRFRDGRFIEAFRRKGRFENLMSEIPVYLISAPNVGLLGAIQLAVGAVR